MRKTPKAKSAAEMEAVEKALDDLFASAVSARDLGREEMRAVVKTFYDMQELRKAAENKKRQLGDKPNALVDLIYRVVSIVEKLIEGVFADWVAGNPPAFWADQRVGIGPVLAVGLASTIDMDKAVNPSKIIRFAGLDNTLKWIGREGAKRIVEALKEQDLTPEAAIPEAARRANVREETVRRFAEQYRDDARRRRRSKGDGEISWDHLSKALARCPWNAWLKTLCWRIGDMFVKNSNRGSFYGDVYKKAKAREEGLDADGAHAEEAARCMAERKGMTLNMRRYYRRGVLPPGRLDLRARRKAVRLFLTHFWEVSYRHHYGKEPPEPWIIAHGGHTDVIRAADAERWEAGRKEERGEDED